MTAVAQTKLASPRYGTMLVFVAYTPDIEACVALAVCLRATLPGES
jgi:hypothetical protein